MKVHFFHRRRLPDSHYSIEAIFERLRDELADRIQSTVVICPHYSRGIWPRIENVLYARQNQATVNHVTGDVNFLAIGLDPKRTILTHHDASFMARTSGLRRYLLGLFWLTLPVRRARFVTVVSDAAKLDLLKYVKCDHSKIVVIHNAIDSGFEPSLRAELSKTPRILQVGTAANKNIVRLAEALAGLNCYLVIIGLLSASQLNALKQFQIKYEVLSDLTNEQIREQYVLADVVAFVSTVEGFGMPIVEAQATGRVVVTSNCSSMPEIAGDAACLVDPLNPQAIRAGFERAIHDSQWRQSLIRKGFENVKRFDHQVIANQYLELYRQIAGASN